MLDSKVLCVVCCVLCVVVWGCAYAGNGVASFSASFSRMLVFLRANRSFRLVFGFSDGDANDLILDFLPFLLHRSFGLRRSIILESLKIAAKCVLSYKVRCRYSHTQAAVCLNSVVVVQRSGSPAAGMGLREKCVLGAVFFPRASLFSSFLGDMLTGCARYRSSL